MSAAVKFLMQHAFCLPKMALIAPQCAPLRMLSVFQRQRSMAIFPTRRRCMMRFAAAAETPDPVARLQAMMRAYVRFGHDHADAYAIAFSPSIHSRPGPALSQSEDFARLAGEQAFAAFHRAVQDVPGLIDPQDKTEHLSRVIWATGHGLVVLSRSKGEALPEPIEVYADALFDALLRMTNTPTQE
jgi:Tetracyclin repressor-like, C-terminal domain